MKNYYELLEVEPGSNVADIRESYRRLVQQNLWDKDKFTELQEAFDVLTSTERREEYNAALFGSGPEMPPLSNDILEPTERMAASEFGRRCPTGAGDKCPLVQGIVLPSAMYCPSCGVEIAALPEPADELDNDVRPWLARFEEETGRQHKLSLGQNMVGREDGEVIVPDKTISRNHARIEVTESGVVTLEDLGSTNGTAVNGDRLPARAFRTLTDGDTVRFGSVRMLLRVAGSDSETPLPRIVDPSAPTDEIEIPAVMPNLALDMPELATTAEPEPPSALERLFRGDMADPVFARAKLLATRGDVTTEHPLLEGLTTFGRRADCTIVLRNDPYVSGSHAQIASEGENFVLTDTGSTNGTLLNGERMTANDPSVLSAGDEIVIGGTIFRFEVTALPSGSAPPSSSARPSASLPDIALPEPDAGGDEAPRSGDTIEAAE